MLLFLLISKIDVSFLINQWACTTLRTLFVGRWNKKEHVFLCCFLVRQLDFFNEIFYINWNEHILFFLLCLSGYLSQFGLCVIFLFFTGYYLNRGITVLWPSRTFSINLLSAHRGMSFDTYGCLHPCYYMSICAYVWNKVGCP